jgi:hemerythrin-like domain-containing protein
MQSSLRAARRPRNSTNQSDRHAGRRKELGRREAKHRPIGDDKLQEYSSTYVLTFNRARVRSNATVRVSKKAERHLRKINPQQPVQTDTLTVAWRVSRYMPRFLNQLYQEHRTIGAVLHGMQYLVDKHRANGTHVDPKVFRAMLYYLDVFPERCHHQKEERFLFPVLRRRSKGADPVLAHFSEWHKDDERRIKALEQAFVRYEEGGEREFQAFAAAAREFIAGYVDHMHREETEIMPLAQQVLTEEDWVDIEIAFALDRDPLPGAEEDSYEKLFSRIVHLAPAPIGLGTTAPGAIS